MWTCGEYSVSLQFNISSCNTTNFPPLCLELMDLLLIGEDQSQAGQPNSLAEGPPMLV
jgi:hypothetical protein